MKQLYLSSVIAGLMMLGWFAVPAFVSADWSTYSQRHWTDRHIVDRGVLEQDSLIRRVDFPTFHDAFGLSLGRDRGRSESERDRGSDSAASGKGTRSYDTFLGPSFDMPDSVDGYSDRLDPWWGRRGESEPMRKDLKELNRDPMRTP